MKNGQNSNWGKSGLMPLVMAAIVWTTLDINSPLNHKYLENKPPSTKNEQTVRKDTYVRREAFVNDDEIEDLNIYENGVLRETWYGTKSGIYFTTESLNDYIHCGEKWGLEPRIDTTLENFRRDTGIY